MTCRYSPVKGSMKPASLLSAWEPHSLFPLLAWTDCRCHLTSVRPSQQRPKDYNCTIPHETSPPLSHEQNQWQSPPPHTHNWRKLQTNLSNLSIGVKHMFWVLVVYYRLCLNINLPSSCSPVFSWLLFSIWAKTTVAGSTWEKKMK